MSNLISKDNMERQIAEMWDAVNNIPSNEPDRDEAINTANKTEADMREMYRKQEAVRNAAPELLEALKTTLAALKDIVTQLPMDQRLADYNLDYCEIAEEKANKAIKKSQS